MGNSLFSGVDNYSVDIAFEYGIVRRTENRLCGRADLQWIYRRKDDCSNWQKPCFYTHFNKKAEELALEDYKPGDKLIPFKVMGEYKRTGSGRHGIRTAYSLGETGDGR